MATSLEDILSRINDKVCALAYCKDGKPVVCQMGFAVKAGYIILHTNTWTQKWNSLHAGEMVAICMGHDHLRDYVQLQGSVQKLSANASEFQVYESYYLSQHPDSKIYKKADQTGLLLVKPTTLKYGKVENGEVSFQEYSF